MTLFSRNGARLLAGLCVLALTACGGGGGGGEVLATPLAPVSVNQSSYAALRQSENVSSALQAVAISTNQTSGAQQVITRSGLYDHSDGSSNVGGAAAQINADVPGLYDFASGFSQSTGGADITGVLGVAIQPEDMPNTGSVTYRGGAVGFVITGDAGIDLTNGRSTVLANFANNRVNVTLDRFTDVDQVTGAAASAPIDTIRVNGMQITDGTYAGGTVITSRSGVAVDITGANTSSRAAGGFFGQEGAIPAETGGVVFSAGDEGQVFGQFIAD